MMKPLEMSIFKAVNQCITDLSTEVKDIIIHTHNVKEDPTETIRRVNNLPTITGECLHKLNMEEPKVPDSCLEQSNFFDQDLKDAANYISPYNGCGVRMGLLDMDTRLERMITLCERN